MSDPTTLEWVNAALEGNQDAFADIVTAYQDSVYNLCYRMLGERSEAEDAAQEAFLRAYLNLTRYDAARSFKALDKGEVAQLLAKTAPVAAKGEFELYKTSNNFDGTAHNPQWLG